MRGTTELSITSYRGIEIQLWKSGERWFASAEGQQCRDRGHRTLSRALECAEEYIDSHDRGSAPRVYCDHAAMHS